MDDGQNHARLASLVWAVRWLAAEPAAALAVADDPRIVPDEIALDLDSWLEVARDWQLVDGRALELLTEIDDTFSAMSGAENGDRWTPDALTMSQEWAVQRERARMVLDVMGEDRADDQLRDHVG